ncbi:flagellar assembly protein FliW [Bacillus dakarensis]|uniref:flagellar assembly protein FliW n=1 Tax=Robertmurraya dakarensis TaxID=1926278 RepID=UPI000980E74E|nr:flagellar assembly protein FliW [Bacillus dakarensis]
MIIKTKYHGEKEINPEHIITFEQGIPSFEDEKKYIVLELGEDSTLFVLQSVTTPELAFLVADPFSFFPTYQFALPDSVIEALKIGNKEDIATFGILTVKEPFEQTTINLQGPIIINSKEKRGKQIVVSEGNYHTKHPLFQQKSSIGEER